MLKELTKLRCLYYKTTTTHRQTFTPMWEVMNQVLLILLCSTASCYFIFHTYVGSYTVTSNKTIFTSKIIRKSEIIQTVPIPKSCGVIETIKIRAHAPLRRSSICPRFTGLPCPARGYNTQNNVALPPVTEVSLLII